MPPTRAPHLPPLLLPTFAWSVLSEGLWFSHPVWQITSVPAAPKTMSFFSSAAQAGLDAPGPLTARLKGSVPFRAA